MTARMTLDEAWAAAEAAMPEGWEHLSLRRARGFGAEAVVYIAEAARFDDSGDAWSGEHPTPVGALLALIADIPKAVS